MPGFPDREALQAHLHFAGACEHARVQLHGHRNCFHTLTASATSQAPKCHFDWRHDAQTPPYKSHSLDLGPAYLPTLNLKSLTIQ